MENTYAQPTPVMGQSPFFYYNPDLTSENKQHGHFSPHPQGPQFQGQDTLQVYQPTGYYQQRPTSAHYSGPYQPQPLLTPVASPQPMHQRPTILVQQESPYLHPIDTGCTDLHFTPATPPLSSSSSVHSSPPPSCDFLPTPVNGVFFGSNECFEGIKQGCEGEVFTEILAGGEWSRSMSPPMTPGKNFPSLDSILDKYSPPCLHSSFTFADDTVVFGRKFEVPGFGLANTRAQFSSSSRATARVPTSFLQLPAPRSHLHHRRFHARPSQSLIVSAVTPEILLFHLRQRTSLLCQHSAQVTTRSTNSFSGVRLLSASPLSRLSHRRNSSATTPTGCQLLSLCLSLTLRTTSLALFTSLPPRTFNSAVQNANALSFCLSPQRRTLS